MSLDPTATVFNPPNHPTFSPSYSHISSTPLQPSSRLVTFAGQIGRDSSTNTLPSSFLEQVEIALKNVKTCLDAAGANKRDIISTRQYIVEIEGHDYQGRVERYLKFMEGHAAPTTLIGVAGLAKKEMLYEIEVMAVVNG